MPPKSRAAIAMELSGLAAQPAETEIEFPAELDNDGDRVTYERIYRANPSEHLFTKSVEPLLIQYIRHIRRSNEIADVLSVLDKQADPKTFLALLKAEKDTSSAMSSLATKLRLTPSATGGFRGEFKKPDSGPKPWEFTGEEY